MDPDNILDTLGSNLKLIEWLVSHHFHKDLGDPAEKLIVVELALLTQGIAQVLVSRQITNRGLSREFQAESARVVTAAAERFAHADQPIAA